MAIQPRDMAHAASASSSRHPGEICTGKSRIHRAGARRQNAGCSAEQCRQENAAERNEEQTALSRTQKRQGVPADPEKRPICAETAAAAGRTSRSKEENQ